MAGNEWPQRGAKIHKKIMGNNSKIEWTDHTFNPWWGCTKVSPACEHCYAETFSKRTGHAVWGKNSERRFFGEKHWNEPLKWNAEAAVGGLSPEARPRVFCASMADVFEVRLDLVAPRLRLLGLIHETRNLDWLLLTKRPGDVLKLLKECLQLSFVTAGGSTAFRDWLQEWLDGKPPVNVWMGTTVEDQERANERVPQLLRIPAKVRFLSCEPLLGPVLLDDGCGSWLSCTSKQGEEEVMDGTDVDCCEAFSDNGDHYHGIDWVICGGESGPGARPMHPDWARGLRDQCARAGVPYLFKQWGEWTEIDQFDPSGDSEYHLEPGPLCGEPRYHSAAVGIDGKTSHDAELVEKPSAKMSRVGKKKAGRLLDGVEWNGFPNHCQQP